MDPLLIKKENEFSVLDSPISTDSGITLQYELDYPEKTGQEETEEKAKVEIDVDGNRALIYRITQTPPISLMFLFAMQVGIYVLMCVRGFYFIIY